MITDLELAIHSQYCYHNPGNFSVDGLTACIFPGIIAFRGTNKQDPRDWFRDINAGIVYDGRVGTVHRGFWVAGNQMMKLIEPIPDGVILTGHSLGGAIALVVGALLVVAGRRPSQIVTFGCPRVGMQTLRTLLAPIAIRQYCYGGDVVPSVPVWPFMHAREPLIKLGPDALGWSDRVSITHHKVENYIDAIRAQERATPSPSPT